MPSPSRAHGCTPRSRVRTPSPGNDASPQPRTTGTTSVLTTALRQCPRGYHVWPHVPHDCKRLSDHARIVSAGWCGDLRRCVDGRWQHRSNRDGCPLAVVMLRLGHLHQQPVQRLARYLSRGEFDAPSARTDDEHLPSGESVPEDEQERSQEAPPRGGSGPFGR